MDFEALTNSQTVDRGRLMAASRKITAWLKGKVKFDKEKVLSKLKITTVGI